MKKNMTDKSSKEYQKMTWEALKKSINGLSFFFLFFFFFFFFLLSNYLLFPLNQPNPPNHSRHYPTPLLTLPSPLPPPLKPPIIITGLINKVNVINIQNILPELIRENIVRGRGLLARSVMKAQTASPVFTHVYAALVAILNSKVGGGGGMKGEGVGGVGGGGLI